MKQLILLLFAAMPLIAQQPKAFDPASEKPVMTKIDFGMELLYDILQNFPSTTPMPADKITQKFNNTIPSTHSVFDITHLAEKILPVAKLPTTHWMAYDHTTKQLIIFTSPSLTTYLRTSIEDKFNQDKPKQVAIQAQLISVNSPEKIIPLWTTEIIEKLDPKPIANFNIVTRSGEKATAMSPADKHQKNKLELEPTLSENGLYIDLRLDLEIYPTDDFQGLYLNTGLTLESQKSLIHPIGISTRPSRTTILILKATIVDSAANPSNKP